MGQIGVAELERRLGSDRLDVRLAAIDALERIMIDSVRDHPAIVELLAAFVRDCPPAAVSGPDLGAGGQPERHPCPPADGQTAVTVLARRPAGRAERGPVNLAGAHLEGVNLLRANLPGVVLAGAHLADANLFYANLPGAVLAGAHLAKTNLFQADLTGADLSCADLTLADLSCANLTRATLAGANLTLVNLIGAGLAGADLTDADLTEASLDGTDLPGVTLTREQKNAILYTG
jgi:Pentapeptide repeats (8 copies)